MCLRIFYGVWCTAENEFSIEMLHECWNNEADNVGWGTINLNLAQNNLCKW